jgi:glycerophosphoryl diester phosphodiesterase
MTIEKIYDRGCVLVDGHRGWCAQYPQNTLLSFQKAIEAGVDMVEFDINMTSDGIPVVIHDNTVDATTGDTGPVRGFSLKQIQSMDAGCRFPGGAFQGQGLTIPTLEALCQLVYPHDLLLNCEIKDYQVDAMDETLRIIGGFPGLLDRVIFTCFDGAVLSYLKEGYGVKCHGFLREHMTHFTRGKYGTYQVMDSICLFGDEVERERVAFFEDFGVLCWGAHANTQEAVEEQLAAGIRLVTCDDPRAALSCLKEKGLR